MVYNFMREYSFRELPNPLIEARQLQASAPGPTSSKAEHIFLIATCAKAAVKYTYTQVAEQVNADRNTQCSHRNKLPQQPPPVPLSGCSG